MNTYNSWMLNILVRWWLHYRKLRLCLGFQALLRAFYRALGKENLCREPRSAQQYSRHCNLCRGSDRWQARTLSIIKTLPRASPRHGAHRRRRSEAVTFGLPSTVPTAPPWGRRHRCHLCRAPPPLLSAKALRWLGFTPVDWPLPRASWGRRQSTRLCRRPTLGTRTKK
jgi:hypothetical protein